MSPRLPRSPCPDRFRPPCCRPPPNSAPPSPACSRGATHRPLDGPERRAAVLLVLYDRDRAPHLLLTKRTTPWCTTPARCRCPGAGVDPATATWPPRRCGRRTRSSASRRTRCACSAGWTTCTPWPRTSSSAPSSPGSPRACARCPTRRRSPASWRCRSPSCCEADAACPPSRTASRCATRCGRGRVGRHRPHPAGVRPDRARRAGPAGRGPAERQAALAPSGSGTRRASIDGGSEGRAGPAAPASPPKASASSRAIWAVSSGLTRVVGREGLASDTTRSRTCRAKCGVAAPTIGASSSSDGTCARAADGHEPIVADRRPARPSHDPPMGPLRRGSWGLPRAAGRPGPALVVLGDHPRHGARVDQGRRRRVVRRRAPHRGRGAAAGPVAHAVNDVGLALGDRSRSRPPRVAEAARSCRPAC